MKRKRLMVLMITAFVTLQSYAQVVNKYGQIIVVDGSETKVTAGTNVTLTGTGTTATPYVLNATGVSGAGDPSVPMWNTLTPSITATTTNPTFNTDRLSLNWRMIGPKEMECVFVINTTTAGTNGSGDYLIPVPGGYSIDTSFDFQKAYTGGVGLNDQNGFWKNAIPGGVGRWIGGGAGGWDVVPIVYDATHIRIVLFYNGYFVRCWGSAALGSVNGLLITARYNLAVL